MGEKWCPSYHSSPRVKFGQDNSIYFCQFKHNYNTLKFYMIYLYKQQGFVRLRAALHLRQILFQHEDINLSKRSEDLYLPYSEEHYPRNYTF